MKFTVIIPTRERADTLVSSLKSAVSQDWLDLEIIVSDNASADNTRDVVLSQDDERIRYIRTDKRLGMSGNWEFATAHASGEWITIIGDDDALLPNSITLAADLISQHPGIRALRSNVCQYQWPAVVGGSYGRLQIPLSDAVEVRSTKAALTEALGGRESYTRLPMLYNGGFVRADVLKMLRGSSGSFYKSRIPDVYSAVAVALGVEEYLLSQRPLAVNGLSRHSTGAAQFSASAGDAKLASDKFDKEENLPFHPDVPLLANGSVPPSIPALLYESYLQAAHVCGEQVPVRPDDVLTAVLLDARENAAMTAWAKLFASNHDLDFMLFEKQAKITRTSVLMSSNIKSVVEIMHTYAVGSERLPIPDVFAASVEAGRILARPPSRAQNLVRLAGRLFGR